MKLLELLPGRNVRFMGQVWVVTAIEVDTVPYLRAKADLIGGDGESREYKLEVTDHFDMSKDGFEAVDL